MRIISLIMTVAILFSSNLAYANEDSLILQPNFDQTKPLSSSEIFGSLPKDIQDEIIHESEVIYKDCENSELFNRMHDCECMAAKVMEERILNGPDRKTFSLKAKVQKSCIDVPAIAGYGFDRCQKQVRDYEPEIHDELCSCYANQLAKSYEKNSRSTLSYLARLGANAMVSCKKKLSIFPYN